ncbi:MAG: hypothetical protein AAF355_06465 [Myxococcota bacterium]
MERNLDGRCGTCGWFVRMATNEDGSSWGDCRLGCWPSPLQDRSTCSSHKPIGASFEGSLRRKRVAGAPRAYRQDVSDQPAARRPNIPTEIGIDMDQEEFRQVLREVLLDELGIRETELGDRWQGGEAVLVPGREGVQEKRIPLDSLFKKVVLIREKLRVLEQKINAHKTLADDEKVQLQQYITGCYGSLTTFNVLFRSKEEGFRGNSGRD